MYNDYSGRGLEALLQACKDNALELQKYSNQLAEQTSKLEYNGLAGYEVDDLKETLEMIRIISTNMAWQRKRLFVLLDRKLNPPEWQDKGKGGYGF